jgi:futalosine hydrolase
MRILLASATAEEISPLRNHLELRFRSIGEGLFSNNRLTVQVQITGVGQVATAYALGRSLAIDKPDLAINLGIAGAFDPGVSLGAVFYVGSECFADLGLEEADGNFVPWYLSGMDTLEAPWYQNGRLLNPHAADTTFLPVARGLTVNTVHGSAGRIEKIRRLYPDADLESMEGAAFFYACLTTGTPFMEIRSVSNHIAPRNRSAWDIPRAVASLNVVAIELLGTW